MALSDTPFMLVSPATRQHDLLVDPAAYPRPRAVKTNLAEPLTDTQLVLLSRASQRDDGLLVPLDTLRGGAARAVASKLLAMELVNEVPIGRDCPHWFRDEEAGSWIGLKVTAAGLRAIGLSADDLDGVEENDGIEQAAMSSATASASTHQEGTKRALVISLLSRPEGASLDQLVEATGWLPHTTRAALTGLRKKGYHLSRVRDDQGRAVYRVPGADEEVPAAQATFGAVVHGGEA